MLFLFLFLISLVSCNTKKEQGNGYTITGNIEGIKSGQAILARLDLVTNERIDLDTAAISKGVFIFKGRLDKPYLHSIYIDGRPKPIHLFLENSKIKIQAEADHLSEAQIEGSREDSLFRTYSTDDIFDRKKGMEIMWEHPDYVFSAFTAYYQFQIFTIDKDTMDLIMERFDAPVKESVYYRHLEKLYETIKRVAVDQPAPSFAIPDKTGTLVRLEDYRGSYVFLDFWASWCAPCRAVNPKLVSVFNAFHNRNFSIVGISIDKDRTRWLQAIEKDGLPWTNLSNLKGWDRVTDAYGVKAIPQNFLLDPDGIIIAKNLEPEELAERLNEVLSY